MSLMRRTADQIALDDLEALFAHWRALSATASEPGPPPRRALDPTALPATLLPRLKIAVREADGGWRYRLVGTAFRDLSGIELSGKRIDEVESAPYARHLTELFDTVTAERRPIFCEARYLGPGRQVHRKVARLLTPFVSGAEVDTVVIGARWTDLAADPVTSLSMLDVDSDLPVAIVEPDSPA
ncbi:MAG: PAS domain-containing protein [Nitratireductor sp.]